MKRQPSLSCLVFHLLQWEERDHGGRRAPVTTLARMCGHSRGRINTASSRSSVVNKTSARRTQPVQVEAHARIFWVESRDHVIGSLMQQGYSVQEPSEQVRGVVNKQASAIRRKGSRKIVMGTLLICIPLLVYFAGAGVVLAFGRLLLITVIPGAWGLWMVFDGLVPALSPKEGMSRSG